MNYPIVGEKFVTLFCVLDEVVITNQKPKYEAVR